MKRLLFFLGLILLLPSMVCAVTVENYDDLAAFYDEYVAGTTSFGTATINGSDVEWVVVGGAVPTTEFYVDTVLIGTLVLDDKEGIIFLLQDYFDLIVATVGGIGGGDLASAYASAAGVMSRLVFQNLVIPSVKSRAELVAEEKTSVNMPRTFAASLSWEDIDFQSTGENGDLYGANIGMAWDTDNISYGFMLPYDHLEFDTFDAERIGLIGFAQYHLELSDSLSAVVTGHLNYTFTAMDFDRGNNDDDISTYGGGFSSSLTLDKELFVISAGASYMYNTDDSDLEDDEQHLLKCGITAGLRNGDNGVFNVFAVWNLDVTNYDVDPKDDDYFDVGVEGSYTFSDTFGLTLGYKKVVDLQDFDADQIYIGSTWKF
jgi:hypothetical protein